MFGMSDLHQMRGRVGRSNKKAFCYLLSPASMLLTSDVRKRLGTLEEFSDLGDGFKVAMRDLDMRGAGNMLGAEQSGFINDLGFETYHKILDEAIRELKETEFKELFASEIDPNEIHNDCNIETDLPVIIPESYIKNLTERLTIYTQLDDITHEEQLEKFQSDLKDRFGELPNEILTLMEIVRLRWLAEKLGFSKLFLKNNQIKAYFVEKPDYFSSDRFKKVMFFMQKNPKLGNFKEIQKKPMLVLTPIKDIQTAKKILSEMWNNEK
jgi:transcription-repair coupling factor (superfamily II helicase)